MAKGKKTQDLFRMHTNLRFLSIVFLSLAAILGVAWYVNSYSERSSAQSFPTPTPTRAVYPSRTPTPATRKCFDSDGGKNYYKYGKTYYADRVFSDSCSYSSKTSRYVLHEYFCTSTNTLGNTFFTCPGSCRNGACVTPTLAPSRYPSPTPPRPSPTLPPKPS